MLVVVTQHIASDSAEQGAGTAGGVGKGGVGKGGGGQRWAVGAGVRPVNVDDPARHKGVVALVFIWKLVALPLGAALLGLLTGPCHISNSSWCPLM